MAKMWRMVRVGLDFQTEKQVSITLILKTSRFIQIRNKTRILKQNNQSKGRKCCRAIFLASMTLIEHCWGCSSALRGHSSALLGNVFTMRNFGEECLNHLCAIHEIRLGELVPLFHPIAYMIHHAFMGKLVLFAIFNEVSMI